MRILLLCVFLLLIDLTFVCAQTKIIAVDTTTGIPMEPLPFHRPFFLKMLARSPKAVKVLLFEHIRNKTLGSTLFHQTVKVINREANGGMIRADTVFETFYPVQVDPAYYFVKKEGNKHYIYIHLRDEYALKPSKQYSLAIYYSATPGTPEVFKLLHQSNNLGNGENNTIRRQKAKIVGQVVEKYNAMATKASLQGELFFGMYPMDYPTIQELDTIKIDSIRKDGIISPSYKWPQTNSSGNKELLAKPQDVAKVQKLVNYYEAKIRAPLTQIDQLATKIDSALASHDTTNIPASVPAGYKELLILFSSIDSLEDSKVRDMFTQDSNRVLRIIQQLKIFTGATYKKVAAGYQLLLCDFCKLTDTTTYEGRTKNIEKTIADIQKVQLITQIYESRLPSFSQLSIFLEKRVKQLTDIHLLVKAISKKNEAATAAINESDQFNSADLTSANTFVFSFETRTKYSLVPEVGLLTNRVFKEGRGSNFLLVPYMGATINFSQLDRDVPFYLIRRKTLWNRTGLVLGWSLVSLKDSTTTPPRDDFFEKSSLVTGLSFRFSNTVKAVFGYNWFYKRSIDTGQRSLTNLPFIGLSFDLDIQKYLTGLFGAVTSLKGAPVTTSNNATP